MILKLARRIYDGWNRFFFEPTSPATIAVFRICFGFVIFLAVLGRYPFREMFYGEHAIVSYETMNAYFPEPAWLYFRWLPQSDPALNLYFLGLLAATVCLILGFCTRLSSVLVFLGLISLSNRNLFIDNAGDDLMRINALIMMFSQAGRAYSIDRLIRRRRGLEGEALPLLTPWAQRLMQIQVAYLYADTFILKLPGEGWQNGTALYYALNYIELRRFRFPFMFYYLWQIKLATWGTMLGEAALAFLVWFRRLRYPILIIGVLLHLGINLTMQFPIFQYVMITSLINFVYPEDFERWLKSLGHFRFRKGN
jgi:uncharacterized membrane protein YphA (DoxX/SURF4 family)